MKSEEDKVPRYCYRTKWNKDSKSESEWNTELARAKKCKRCQEVFGPCKLL